jgi:hypothetical protein
VSGEKEILKPGWDSRRSRGIDETDFLSMMDSSSGSRGGPSLSMLPSYGRLVGRIWAVLVLLTEDFPKDQELLSLRSDND